MMMSYCIMDFLWQTKRPWLYLISLSFSISPPSSKMGSEKKKCHAPSHNRHSDRIESIQCCRQYSNLVTKLTISPLIVFVVLKNITLEQTHNHWSVAQSPVSLNATKKKDSHAFIQRLLFAGHFFFMFHAALLLLNYYQILYLFSLFLYFKFLLKVFRKLVCRPFAVRYFVCLYCGANDFVWIQKNTVMATNDVRYKFKDLKYVHERTKWSVVAVFLIWTKIFCGLADGFFRFEFHSLV